MPRSHDIWGGVSCFGALFGFGNQEDDQQCKGAQDGAGHAPGKRVAALAFGDEMAGDHGDGEDKKQDQVHGATYRLRIMLAAWHVAEGLNHTVLILCVCVGIHHKTLFDNHHADFSDSPDTEYSPGSRMCCA